MVVKWYEMLWEVWFGWLVMLCRLFGLFVFCVWYFVYGGGCLCCFVLGCVVVVRWLCVWWILFFLVWCFFLMLVLEFCNCLCFVGEMELVVWFIECWDVGWVLYRFCWSVWCLFCLFDRLWMVVVCWILGNIVCCVGLEIVSCWLVCWCCVGCSVIFICLLWWWLLCVCWLVNFCCSDCFSVYWNVCWCCM